MMVKCKSCGASFDPAKEDNMCPECGAGHEVDIFSDQFLTEEELVEKSHEEEMSKAIYKILDESTQSAIKSGGYGKIFKFQRKKDKKWVALKRFCPSGSNRSSESMSLSEKRGTKPLTDIQKVAMLQAKDDRERALETIIREREIMYKCNSDYIPRIMEKFSYPEENPQVVAYVTEFIDGQDLADIYFTKVAKEGTPPCFTSRTDKLVENITEAAVSVLYALKELKVNGIVHLDIKPPNIMYGKVSGEDENRYFLIDYGAAELFDSKCLKAARFYTPCYTLDKEKFTFATDLFSLGISLKHLLIGREDKPEVEGDKNLPNVKACNKENKEAYEKIRAAHKLSPLFKFIDRAVEVVPAMRGTVEEALELLDKKETFKCWSCGGGIFEASVRCGHCGKLQTPSVRSGWVSQNGGATNNIARMYVTSKTYDANAPFATLDINSGFPVSGADSLFYQSGECELAALSYGDLIKYKDKARAVHKAALPCAVAKTPAIVGDELFVPLTNGRVNVYDMKLEFLHGIDLGLAASVSLVSDEKYCYLASGARVFRIFGNKYNYYSVSLPSELKTTLTIGQDANGQSIVAAACADGKIYFIKPSDFLNPGVKPFFIETDGMINTAMVFASGCLFYICDKSATSQELVCCDMQGHTRGVYALVNRAIGSPAVVEEDLYLSTVSGLVSVKFRRDAVNLLSGATLDETKKPDKLCAFINSVYGVGVKGFVKSASGKTQKQLDSPSDATVCAIWGEHIILKSKNRLYFLGQ